MPRQSIKKLDWLDRAIETHKYHIDRLKKDSSWTIEKTALDLNRSLGSIAQDLTIVSWLISHEEEIRSCDTQQRALNFIKRKKKELSLRAYK